MHRQNNKINKKISIQSNDFEKMFGEKLNSYVKDKISEYKLIYSPLEKE